MILCTGRRVSAILMAAALRQLTIRAALFPGARSRLRLWLGRPQYLLQIFLMALVGPYKQTQPTPNRPPATTMSTQHTTLPDRCIPSRIHFLRQLTLLMGLRPMLTMPWAVRPKL